MKKILISVAITMSLLSASVQAEGTKFVSENTTVADIISSKSANIQKMYETNPEFFITSERLEDDLELEEMLIASFDEKFVKRKSEFSTKEYNHLMNSYFIDALKTSNSNLADFILYKSGAIIDVNYQGSEDPKISPLQAAATSIEIEGGNIEYFIKLVEMGADPSELTKGYDIPLMSLAATVDNYKIVLYLAMLGENIMHVDGYDYYPLDYAVKNESYKSVSVLTNLIKIYKNNIEEKRKLEQ